MWGGRGEGNGCNFARKIEATAAGETRVSSLGAHVALPPTLYQFCQLSIRPSPAGGGVNKAPFEVRDPRNPICGGGCWERKRRGRRKKEGRKERGREGEKDRDRHEHLRILAPAITLGP